MRTLPEFLYALENFSSHGKDLLNRELEESEYEEYVKLKKIIETSPRIDSRKLKVSSKFKSKLFNILFSTPLSKSKYNLTQRNIVEIVKLKAVADILRLLAFSRPSNEIFKKVRAKSMKYEFNDGVLSSVRRLMRHEADYGSRRKAAAYYEDAQFALKKQSYQIQSEWYSADLRHHFSKYKEITRTIREKSKKYFLELNEIPEEYWSWEFLVNFNTVGIIHFESSFEYYKLCDFLAYNLEQFKQRYPELSGPISSVTVYYVYYLIRIKEILKAKEQIEIGLSFCKKHSLRWFRFKELEMLNSLRSADTESSVSIYVKLKSENRYSTLGSAIRNRIELIWLFACIYNALKAGKVEGPKLLKDFRLGKYLNSIPDFTIDKKGMNVPIIIVQLLYYIIMRDLDKLDDRFEAVQKYLTRHMKSDPLYRSSSFVKMLLQVPKQNFHPAAISRHTVKYLKNLKSIPFLKSKQPIEIELMEYELIWDALMDYLKGKVTN